MLTFPRLMLGVLALFGLTSRCSAGYTLPEDMPDGGVNLGAGNSFASHYLIQIDFVEPAALLQNAKNPELDFNLGLLRLIADHAMTEGPYTVTNVSLPYGLPPNGDVHEYYSWAPYWHPQNDSKGCVDDPNYMKLCKYIQQDGLFNPDLSYIRQKPAFINMAADTVSLALASEVFGDYDYLARAAHEIRYFFLNEETFMRPDFDFTQIRRGPSTWVGVATGIIDARWLMYVTVTLNILNSHINEMLPGQTEVIWTSEDHDGMAQWMSEMTQWMTTASIAVSAGKQKNNHATWYFAQSSMYAYFGGNNAESARIIRQFLNGIYQTFFTADGGQPLELARSKPFHYSMFNLEPLLCIAKLGDKVGVDVWSWPSPAGNQTIKTAVDFLLTRGWGAEDPVEIVPFLMAVRARWGDADGKYAYWIANITTMMDNPPLYPMWQYPLYTPPTSDATFTPTPNANGWIQQDAQVLISARDTSNSGVANMNVTVDGVLSTIVFGNAAASNIHVLTLSNEGVHTVSYCAENGQGDNEVCTKDHSLTISIDKTSPVVMFTDAAAPQFHYDIGQTINIACSATDAVSGIMSSVCPSVVADATSYPLYPATTTISANAVDMAGHVSQTQAQIMVTSSFDGLCSVTRRYLTPFNPLAATDLCHKLGHAAGLSSHLLRNLELDVYITEVRVLKLGRLTSEQAAVLVNGAKALKA